MGLFFRLRTWRECPRLFSMCDLLNDLCFSPPEQLQSRGSGWWWSDGRFAALHSQACIQLIRQGDQTVDDLASWRLEITLVEALHKRKDNKQHKDEVHNGHRIMFIAMIQGPMLAECVEDIILRLPSGMTYFP